MKLSVDSSLNYQLLEGRVHLWVIFVQLLVYSFKEIPRRCLQTWNERGKIGGHDLDCCFMRIKNTGNNRTFGAHKRMDKRWKLLKFREPGSIGRKTQKPSSFFIGLLLFSFIHLLRCIMSWMIFSLEFKKTRGELSQIYLCDFFFSLGYYSLLIQSF